MVLFLYPVIYRYQYNGRARHLYNQKKRGDETPQENQTVNYVFRICPTPYEPRFLGEKIGRSKGIGAKQRKKTEKTKTRQKKRKQNELE